MGVGVSFDVCASVRARVRACARACVRACVAVIVVRLNILNTIQIFTDVSWNDH